MPVMPDAATLSAGAHAQVDARGKQNPPAQTRFQPVCANLMVEIGHLPSCPRIEIRRPCNSSSQTFSTVPALPSVRITALPTSADCACSNAPRIVDAESFTVRMGDPGLNASVFASERRANRDRLAANGCPMEPRTIRPSGNVRRRRDAGPSGTRRSKPPVHMVRLTKEDRAAGAGWSRRRCLIAPAEGAYSVDGDGNQMHLRCDLGADRGPDRGPRPRRFPVQLRANPRNLESVARSPIPTLESGGREALTLHFPDHLPGCKPSVMFGLEIVRRHDDGAAMRWTPIASAVPRGDHVMPKRIECSAG